MTVHADDVKDINQEAIVTIQASRNILNQELIPLTLKQNEDKAEHATSFLGNGQEQFTKHFTHEVTEFRKGTSKSAARHLGNFCSYDNHNNTIVSTRIYKAKEAFYSLGRLWKPTSRWP